MNRIDLNWDDNEVLPDKIRPDVEFLFSRMNQATIEMVDPKPGEYVLDVGCGRATDIVSMSKSGAVLIGIEPSVVMLSHARESIKSNGQNVAILQAIGESIPVVPDLIDKVVCKGALDHFSDPDRAMQQMSTVIKPEGRVIIVIANFESLGFKIGRFIFWIRKLMHIRNPYKRLPWEPPPDHTMKFDYGLISKMTKRYLKMEKIIGVSLLCCMPGWGNMLSIFPATISGFVLVALDRLSHFLPCLSDVVIIRCTPK